MQYTGKCRLTKYSALAVQLLSGWSTRYDEMDCVGKRKRLCFPAFMYKMNADDMIEAADRKMRALDRADALSFIKCKKSAKYEHNV